AGDLHLAASRHISIDRQRARPYDGHGRLTASDPSPRSAQNEARRDPSRSPKTGKSWPAQRQPGGDIVKEHGQTRGRDAQEIKPSTHAAAAVRGRSTGGSARRVQATAVRRTYQRGRLPPLPGIGVKG